MVLNRHITKNPRNLSFNRVEDIVRHMGIPAQEFRQIRADDLQVDHGYQRPLSPTHVNQIAKAFDPLLFGIILISQRADGTYWILDGQQRVGAIRKRGKGQNLLPCEVLTGLSWAKEAEIFDKRNKNRRTLTPQEKFKGALAWGDSDAVAVAHTVRESGFVLNLSDGSLQNGGIPGTSSLLQVGKQYRHGHLAETLKIIRATWGAETGPRGVMIDGIALFLSVYRDRHSVNRFVQAMSRVTMEHIVREAKEYRKATGTIPRHALCAILLRHYNDRIHEENRLPSIEQVRALQAVKEAQRGS